MYPLFLVKKRYTIGEASTLTGLSRRQLTTWDKNGFYPASGFEKGQGRIGIRRYYSPEDLLKLQFIAFLRKAGLTPKKIKRILKSLEKLGINLLAFLLEGKNYHILTDGETVTLYKSETEVIDLLKKPGQRLLWFAVHDHFNQITEEVEQSIMKKISDHINIKLIS